MIAAGGAAWRDAAAAPTNEALSGMTKDISRLITSIEESGLLYRRNPKPKIVGTLARFASGFVREGSSRWQKLRRSAVKSQLWHLHKELIELDKGSQGTRSRKGKRKILLTPAESGSVRDAFLPPARSRAIVGSRTAPGELKAGLPAPIVERFHPFPEGYYEAESRAAWLAENVETICDTVLGALDGKTCLSLDVFDTFLLRGAEAEATRCLEFSARIAEELERSGERPAAGSLSAEDLCLLRTNGMRLTYRCRPRRRGCGEGHIEDVARLISRWIAGDGSLTERLLDLETRFESEKLVRNAALSEAALRFRKAGGKVILVSDMYLPKTMIQEICENVDPEGSAAVDRIFSSADEILSKRSGRIFEFIAEEMGLDSRDFLHVGDSFLGDVEMPRENGWDALHFPISRREAELRQASLQGTVTHFLDRGIDVSDWAKV